MTDLATHTGSCHCGNVRFQIRANVDSVVACNCSICNRAGYLLAFVPEEHFTLLAGQDAQTDYQFGKKHIHHLFCKTCGIHCFGNGAGPEGKSMVAVNMRCIEDADLSGLKTNHYDGKSK